MIAPKFPLPGAWFAVHGHLTCFPASIANKKNPTCFAIILAPSGYDKVQEKQFWKSRIFADKAPRCLQFLNLSWIGKLYIKMFTVH